MVSPAELTSWQPDRLGEIADEVAAHRSVLTRLDDDIESGRPPSSWTFDDATGARAEHGRLSELLATQVSETVGVIEALDTAATAIRRAKTSLEGAMSRARNHGLSVDTATGAVSSTRTYDDPDDAADAQVVVNEVAEQISTALTDAATADQALATVLNAAATTDVNAVGSLAQQREVLDFENLSQADQVQYLLDHPSTFTLLGDHASPEVKAQVGQGVADQLDAAARDGQVFGDADAVERYTALLDAFGGDPDVMGPLYTRLGPDGLLATYNGMTSMMYVGVNNEELAALAGELRSGLETATQQDGFDGRKYGEDLVRYATSTVSDDERDAFSSAYRSQGEHAAVLDYLLRDGDYGQDFVRGVAWELDDFERADPLRAQTWMHHAGFASPLNGLGVDADGIYQPDPMAATMGQLGKHPGLGLEFFSDSEGTARSDFYFAERDWSRDGFAGISEAALAIGTDPDNIANDSAKTGMFVSEFFDRMPDNEHFTADRAPGAAEPVANLLKHYMPSVDAAIGSSEAGDHGARIRDFTTNPYLGSLFDQPVLDPKDLDGLLKVALSSEDGMARIAEGVAGLRQTQLTNFALQHPGEDGARENFAGLQSILNSGSRVEGYMQHAVGDIAIEGAKSEDQRVAVFTGLVSEAAGLLPVPFADEAGEVVGDLGKKAWETAWGHVQEIPTDHITESFGSNEDAEKNEQTGEAQLGRENMVIGTYLSLVESGVLEVPDAMRDTWAPGGDLISLGDIRPEDVQTFRSEASDALGRILSVSELELTYKDPFTGWHE